MRNLTVYDAFESGKIYQIPTQYAKELFQRRSMHMSEMAKHVELNPFIITRVTIQQDPNLVHIQYQLEHMGPIRSAFVEKHSIALLCRVKTEFVKGEEYRTAPANKAIIVTQYGENFWNQIGVQPFTVEDIVTVPNPAAPKTLRLMAIRNHRGHTWNFSMHINDADLFTSTKWSILKPKTVDNKPKHAIVTTLELAPIRNEKERLAAIKLLESVRYESMS